MSRQIVGVPVMVSHINSKNEKDCQISKDIFQHQVCTSWCLILIAKMKKIAKLKIFSNIKYVVTILYVFLCRIVLSTVLLSQSFLCKARACLMYSCPIYFCVLIHTILPYLPLHCTIIEIEIQSPKSPHVPAAQSIDRVKFHFFVDQELINFNK